MNETIDAWEAAYLRFESPEEEVRKFVKRLRKLGAPSWPRDAQIVELFCGRGGGLQAWGQLGFQHIEGVDLSGRLLAQYKGNARTWQADCRELPFDDCSRDVLIVQGGLHHLERLPPDLDRVLAEARRVLRPGGRFVCVEPWRTPFLRIVHAACRVRLARWLWPKLDDLAIMIEHERRTYEQWLASGALIRETLDRFFAQERRSIGWGKLAYVGQRRDGRA